MNYVGIIKDDLANGEDIGVALFVSGCDLHCENGECHGKDYYSFDCGIPFDNKAKEEIFKLFEDNIHYGRLTLTGGNPTSGDSPKVLLEFVKEFKQKFPNIKIWLYSGHTYEEILTMKNANNLMQECDVLIDGRWIKSLHSVKLAYRGSSNQRIIDIKKSREKGNIVLLKECL